MKPKFRDIEKILQENISPDKISKILKLIVVEYENLQKITKIIDDVTTPDYLKKFLQRSLIVNMVSILESFYKHQFIYLIDFGQIENKDLLKIIPATKLKINEMPLLLKNKISVGSFLSEYLNFQKLEDINKIFTTLLKNNSKSYFDELKDILDNPKVLTFITQAEEYLYEMFDKFLESYPIRNSKHVIKQVLQEIRVTLEEKFQRIYIELDRMINLRHIIIHDIFNVPEIEKDLINNSFLFSLLCMASHIYLFYEKYPDYFEILKDLIK
jgi:hypothetical protein